MITQYSHIQLTLSEKEKEYAWFQYAAELCKAGCRDQSLSGYSVNGIGIDGKPVKAELTNEELFQLFAEITMKYGKRMLREHENSQKKQQEIEQIVPDEENQNKINPLDRRDFQIMITKNEQKTRKADVQITWGNNLQIEGLRIYGRTNGDVRLVVPSYFAANGSRINLMAVGSKLEQAILSAYQKMDQQDKLRFAYYGEEIGIRVQTRSAQEGKVIGYANIVIGQEFQIMQVRIRQNEGKLSCMYPSESILVVSTAISNPFNAVLTSPFDIAANFFNVSSSIFMLYCFSPSSLVNEFFKIVYIFSSVNGSSFITIDLDIKALFTSKYGFSVVAPIKIIRPFSTYGSSASCCNLLNL